MVNADTKQSTVFTINSKINNPGTHFDENFSWVLFKPQGSNYESIEFDCPAFPRCRSAGLYWLWSITKIS